MSVKRYRLLEDDELVKRKCVDLKHERNIFGMKKKLSKIEYIDI